MHLLLLVLLLPACVAYLTTKPNLGSAYSTVGKSKLCVGQTESSSLTYLVDTTGSMYDDFLQLKLVNSWLLDRVTARFPCGVRQYTMVEFNDPTVGPVKVTNSKTEFGHFFNSLVASGGGDCPELALEGLELALNNSPSNSFILVLTDASAKDYNDIALLNNIRSLINTTKSQVFFLITGLCMGLSDPQFLVYRDIALQSFGHVFQVDLFDLGKVFHYLDFTLSRPANTSTRLFSGEYTVGNHSDSFPVADNFTSLLVTTDGVIYSLKIVGPHNIDLELKKIVSEIWGSMYLLKNPIKGIWTMYIYAGGPHSVRVEGFTAINISSTANCSECDPNATCKEEMGFLECSCKDGFIGDGFTCTDIDECTYAWSNNCSFDCINTFGSYECLCRSGYSQISGNTCVDIDECSTSELNNCHPLASCQNYEGSYLCYCPSGYFGDGIYCEVDECSKDVCGFGVDCIKSNGSFHCSDPCSNYTILNDPWRSSANIYVSLWNCDHYINGWYRFIGSGGVRMPEYCVPTFSCDTAAPMWLSGSHPLLTDGIVNRTACAHWSDSCCLWSTTVQIKACPEGYHVYKLSGTPTCSLSYCTDPASANDSLTCAADEEWKVIDGEYGCHCKDKYKISGVEDLRPELVCEAHSMRAKFHKCQLKSLKLDIRNIRFRGSECFGFQNDNITNEFSVLSPLQDGICGVRLRKNATHAIYVNTLDFSLDYEDTVIREEQLSITLSCAYPLNMMVSLETAVRPIMSSTNISVDGTGQFTAHIALYQDSSYLSPYEGSEVVLSSKSTLYIGVIVDGVDSSEYTVVMKNCYATPTQNANDSIKYYIIKNSCPNRQDKTIKVMENGVSDKGRFSVQIFKFIGDYNLIFLHCEIKLCDPSASACTPTCSGSRAASDSNEQSFVLNVGPVVRGDVSLSSASGTHYPWTLFAFPLLFLTTILFNI